MRDLTSPKLIYAKGILFLVLGGLSLALLLVMHPSLDVAVLSAVSIWAFARFYYFVFYVIQHYVDDGFRYSGLWDFAWRWGQRRRQGGSRKPKP